MNIDDISDSFIQLQIYLKLYTNNYILRVLQAVITIHFSISKTLCYHYVLLLMIFYLKRQSPKGILDRHALFFET